MGEITRKELQRHDSLLSKETMETASTVSTGNSASSGKSVHFQLERNETLEFEIDYLDVIDEIWFTGDDYIRIKAKSREEARAWRRQGYGMLLKESFESTRPEVQRYLHAFCQQEDELCRRGLERHLSRHHAEERSDRKDCARQAVFITQERLSRRGVQGQEIWERVSQAYIQQCRLAKIFARRMAIADELVIAQGEDSTVAQTILEEVAASGGHGKMERRLSNFSTVSSNSMNSMDSRRRWAAQNSPAPKQGRRCPNSPSSAMDDYVAAVA